MPLQFDPLDALRKVWAMKYGRHLIVATLLPTVLFLLGALLFGAHAAITGAVPGSVGINVWMAIVQQPRFAFGAAFDIVLMVVMWLCVLLVSLKDSSLTLDKSETREANEQEHRVIVLPPQLVITIHDIAFGISGDEGYPLLNEAKWLRLSIVFEGNARIETAELVISGKAPIPAFEWEPGRSAYYHYFQVPDWVKSKEERTIQVQSFANGVKWGSLEMSVNFPA